MSVLLERPGLPMSALAEAAVLPSASLTRHVDRLVERALVVRRVDPHDKRRARSPPSRRWAASLALRLRSCEREIEHDIVAGLGSERYTRADPRAAGPAAPVRLRSYRLAADQHRLVDEPDAEARLHAVANLPGQRQQVVRGGAAPVGEREGVPGRQAGRCRAPYPSRSRRARSARPRWS